eukprot:jgi/Psemu1/17907/gm1.17907_g
MSLFRRRKSEKEKTTDRSDKEVMLQDQVDDLQAEMKRLNERLVAMQSKIQSNGTTSRHKLKSPVPSSSVRSGRMNSDPVRDGPPHVRLDQSPIQRSYRKKKVSKGMHVPKEINFVSSETLQNGKETARPDLCVSDIYPSIDKPPLQSLEMASPKQNGNGTSKKLVGDGGSAANYPKSYYTMRNGRKVKRIIRMVRAVPPSTQATPHSTITTSNNFAPRGTLPSGGKDETLIRNQDTIESSEVVSKERSGNQDGSVTVQLSNLSSSKKQLTGGNVRVKETSQHDVHSTAHCPYPKPGIASDAQGGMKGIGIGAVDPINSGKTGVISGVKLDESEKSSERTSNKPIDFLAAVQAGVKLNPTRDANQKAANPTARSMPDTEATISGVKLDKSDKSSERTSNKPVGFLAALQAGVKLNPTGDENQKAANPTAGSMPSTGAPASAKRSQNGNSMAIAPNPARGLLADIRVGVELKKAEPEVSDSKSHNNLPPKDESACNSLKQTAISKPTAPNPARGFLADIKAGVELKTVEKIAAKTQSPSNPLLEGIKAGVKLKQVDRSLLQAPKKRETPMSVLLAKIQQRKKECLQRENSSSLTTEDPEIDW